MEIKRRWPTITYHDELMSASLSSIGESTAVPYSPRSPSPLVVSGHVTTIGKTTKPSVTFAASNPGEHLTGDVR